MTSDSENAVDEQGSRHATAEEIRDWNEENDDPHPVFAVPYRPERIALPEVTEDTDE